MAKDEILSHSGDEVKKRTKSSKCTVNFYTDNLWRIMLITALPGIAGMLIISVNSFFDAVFISHFLGSDALMGISLTIPASTIITAVTGMISAGSASVLSRTIGSGVIEKQLKIPGTVFWMSLSLSVVLTPFFYFSSPYFIQLMGADGKALEYGVAFFQFTVLGLFFTVFGLSLNSLIRAEGKIKTAMLFSFLSVICNVLFNFLFVAYAGWGVKGSAIATIISMIVYCFANFWYFFLRKRNHKAGLINWPDFKLMREIVDVGLASLLMQINNFIRQVFMFKTVAYYGNPDQLTFFSAVFRIFSLTAIPVFGILQALQPVIGINYGAGNIKRVREAMKIYRMSGVFVLLIITLPMLIFPQMFLELVLPEQEFSVTDILCFRLMVLILPCIPLSSSSIIFFQATGISKWATRLSLGREFLLFIPLVIALPFYFGVPGVYAGIISENIIYAGITFFTAQCQLSKLETNCISV